MDKEIRRSILSGGLPAQPSRALAMRAIILSSISPSKTSIPNVPSSPDVTAAADCCRQLGAKIAAKEGGMEITGVESLAAPSLDVGASISAFRLLLPVSFLFREDTKFSGSPAFGERKIAPHAEYIASQCLGISYKGQEGNLPLSIRGPLSSTDIVYPASLGASLLSGILMFAPLTEGYAKIGIDGGIWGYETIGGTMTLLEQCGVECADLDGQAISLLATEDFSAPSELRVPPSHCEPSYLLLAGALCGKVEIAGMRPAPKLEYVLRAFGATASYSEGRFTSSAGSLTGAKIGADDAGSYLFHAMVLAASSEGKSEIVGMAALPARQKKSAVLLARELARMGAKFTPTDEGMEIEGARLVGAEFEPEGDSHVAMACSAAALSARTASIIYGAECVEGRHPLFFKSLISLGGIVRESAGTGAGATSSQYKPVR